jgi:hypothetical protein
MTTQIWIETVKRPDGRKRYSTERGLLLIARLGSPDSEILVYGAHNVVCEGLSCPHEPRQCIRRLRLHDRRHRAGAGLIVYEPDDGLVHFARWRRFDQNAVSRSAALAREDDGAGREVAADTITCSGAGGERLAEAAEKAWRQVEGSSPSIVSRNQPSRNDEPAPIRLGRGAMRLLVERCSHISYIAALPYFIANGVLFLGEKENLAVWAAVHMGGGPRDDHRYDLHPPTNRFLTDRACYIFPHSCSPDSASTPHRLRASGPKPVNIASLSTSCPHAFT